ncbi:Rne/Rng family ribonuclease [Actinomadura alba]|uniref:Ribonuclease E/G n=1 Tax=Actinomadura alba TaxID=406431 RepID=A0ABR7M0L2_9ACTN|nr:Rne/Rng family ribonuclease [Actinomadura alba]MBC6470632.1 ribonuclease E/G [Actinomadura alba]
MLENEADSANGAEGTEQTDSDSTGVEMSAERRPRRRAASRPAGPPPEIDDTPAAPVPAVPAAAAPSGDQASPPEPDVESPAEPADEPVKPKKTTRSRSRKRETAPEPAEPRDVPEEPAVEVSVVGIPAVTFQPPMVVFQPAGPPEQAAPAAPAAGGKARVEEPDDEAAESGDEADDDESGDRPSRRRRRRGGRGRGKAKDGADESADDTSDEEDRPAAAAKAEPAERQGKATRAGKAEKPEKSDEDDDTDEDDGTAGSTRRRRRRRRRAVGVADTDDTGQDDPPNTVVHVREARAVEDEVQSVKGSTRLEAKKQRRREGREQGRRRPPIITESEFLARREAVERVMVVRQEGERTQIAVLEDDVLVEHYVDRASHQSYVGNVYLGKVQNVLPSMEAAFVDIGKGRNAVLYAGEVNWDIAGLEGQPRRIESALRSGQSVLVQVTKDPLGHKGARLTSQVSLPGRYLVYVPDGSMTGISRKLPDKERARLKQILKRVMPENAGVIVRTAAEGATEEELARDVSRLAAQWENIQRQSKTASAPELLYGEPDLTIRVVRDIFNEDFGELVVSGDQAWSMVEDYVSYVAPHLAGRATKWTGPEDVLTTYRIDEQIAKALERKVWLPSGGSLVIDRTEAMTVVDVNTGKFTGQGGNLEETVTRNNLEAAEEIVRQLRLRDLGGIIVVDFIDMVLESNRDLVLRRLLECLARDRTKHQVAEVTSLGLVQMTRKRVGQGLLEAFSEVCECCNGRGIHVSLTPVEDKPEQAATPRRRKRKGDVEKTVEKKLARHEAERPAVADHEDETGKPDRKQGRAKGGRSRAKATSASAEAVEAAEVAESLESVETVETRTLPGMPEPVALAAENAAEDAAESAVEVRATLGAVEAVDPVDPVGAGAPAEPKGPEEDAAATSNGRKRRPRRSRAKAEVGSEDAD